MQNQAMLAVVLREFARCVVAAPPSQRILDDLVEYVAELARVTGAGASLIAADGSQSHLAASSPLGRHVQLLQPKLGDGPCLAAFASGAMVRVDDLTADRRFPLFAPEAVDAGVRSVVSLPIVHDGERLGALDLYGASPGAIPDAAVEAVQVLADVAAVYLVNAREREAERSAIDEFRHRALHDELTGLPNRTLFRDRVAQAAKRASRAASHAAVLFVDIDRFKAVNDAYGHAAGDELLCAVAARLQALVRVGDTLARLSGDEFVILCEDIQGPHDATRLARRIGEVFAQPIELMDHTVTLDVRVSVGAVYARRADDITEDLIRTADMAMYSVKHDGGARHRVLEIDDGHVVDTAERAGST